MITTKIYTNQYLTVQKPLVAPIMGEVSFFDKHKELIVKITNISAMTGILLLSGGGIDVFASEPSINSKMEDLYYGKFIWIAMWILIGKGGWDIVHKSIKEDFEGAKKSTLQYILVFAALFALPTALKAVQEIFRTW